MPMAKPIFSIITGSLTQTNGLKETSQVKTHHKKLSSNQKQCFHIYYISF